MQPTDPQSKPAATPCRRVVPPGLKFLILLLGLSVGLLQAEAGDRSIGVAPAGQPESVPISGDYWAVLIGIDEYAHAPDLESAVKDVRACEPCWRRDMAFTPTTSSNCSIRRPRARTLKIPCMR